MRTRYDDIEPYRTKDGSEIRELMHPAMHGNHTQSLAEAILPVHASTQLHRHHLSEEIYHFLSGTGRMTLGERKFTVAEGDTVNIPPGTPHRLTNTGDVPLRLLCSCSPPYSHDDTELL